MNKFLLASLCTLGISLAQSVPAFSQSTNEIAQVGAAVTKSTASTVDAEKQSQARYPVFVVTDRQLKRSRHGIEFTGERAPTVTYATSAWSDKDGDVRADQPIIYKSQEQFLAALKNTGAKQVTVFVPGYRKSFDSSIECAAQIAARLKHPLVVFAWPSKNKYSAYMTDECTAEWSSHTLAGLLQTMGDRFGAGNVNIIGHSLAARMICWAFGTLAQNEQLETPFKSLLLFSPDIDRDVFISDAPLIRRACNNVKIFIDKHDSRLWLSKLLHGGPRLGDVADENLITKVFKRADFDTSMKCHRITPELLTAAFPMASSGVPAVVRSH